MALNAEFLGRVYPPTPVYLVGREKVREFAASIGDTNPISNDPEAAQALGYADVVAPPTFAIVITLDAGGQVTHDPELGLDYARVVHGEQRFVHQRAVVAGDELQVIVTVDDIRVVAGNDMLELRADVVTPDGEPVLTAYTLLIGRGQA